MIIFGWFLGFGMNIFPLIGALGAIEKHEFKYSCTITDDENGKNPKVPFMIFSFLLPCTTIIICYCLVFCKIRKSRKELVAYFQQQKESEKAKDMKMIKMILIVFLCFLATFLPVMLINVIDKKVEYPDLHVFFDVIWWSASVINPIIYVFRNEQYKKAIKLMCKKMLFMNQSSPADYHSTTVPNITATTGISFRLDRSSVNIND